MGFFPRVFFHFSSISIKQSFFLNPIRHFDKVSSTKLSVWVYMILDMRRKTRTGLSFTSLHHFSAAYRSSGKQPFLKNKLIIFVRIEVRISIVAYNIPAEISSTRMDFVWSKKKFYFASLTSWNENLSGVLKDSWNLKILSWQRNLSSITSTMVRASERACVFLNLNLLLYLQNICSSWWLKLSRQRLHFSLLASVD